MKSGRHCFSRTVSKLCGLEAPVPDLSPPASPLPHSPPLDPRDSPPGMACGVKSNGKSHPQVLEGILAQVPGEPVHDVRLQDAGRGPPEHPAQDVHALQGAEQLEAPLQRDEKQAAVHARALQGASAGLPQVDGGAFQLLQGRAASQFGSSSGDIPQCRLTPCG